MKPRTKQIGCWLALLILTLNVFPFSAAASAECLSGCCRHIGMEPQGTVQISGVTGHGCCCSPQAATPCQLAATPVVSSNLFIPATHRVDRLPPDSFLPVITNATPDAPLRWRTSAASHSRAGLKILPVYLERMTFLC